MTMANSAESESRIPVTLRRSSSLRQKGERCYHRSHQPELFPAITENAETKCARPAVLRRSSSSLSLTPTRGSTAASPRALRLGSAEDCAASDVDSVRSYGSNCSSAASVCEHAHFGLNGTTWSGRSRRYLVHCSPQAAGDSGNEATAEQYLTPTQRTARQLRSVQALLKQARKQLDERDREIGRLTKELVELRLFKASLQSSPEAPTARDKPSAELAASPLVDSGHFEDGSATQLQPQPVRPPTHSPEPQQSAGCHFERRIDEMQRRQIDEMQLIKQAHHEKLEALLEQLADMSARYCEARPALEQAQARSRQLEAEAEELRQQLRRNQALLADQLERDKHAYLELYEKAQQQDQPPRGESPGKITVAELLQQLTVTQAELDNVKAMYRRILESRNKQNSLDPEITLQFLKSAVYYFLTDKENLHGHLNAIESILGFTDSEKLNIDRIYRSAKK